MDMLAHMSGLLQNVFFLGISFLGIGFITIFHECGHFVFCKLFGIYVASFSIGMGPMLLKKKIGQTTFALSLLPIGGYVEVADSDEDGLIPESALLRNKPYYQKMLMVGAGNVFNILLSALLFAILFFRGMPATPLLYPENATSTISGIVADSPAEKAGMKANDTIVSLDGQCVDGRASTLINYVEQHPGTPLKVAIMRDSKKQTITAVPEKTAVGDKTVGKLGLNFTMHATPPYSLVESVQQGFRLAIASFVKITTTLKTLIAQKTIGQHVGGPVMIFSQAIKGARHGLSSFLLLLALISINLAILNFLPLPILDGGHALFYTIEAITRRPIPDTIRHYIHLSCWILFVGLTVFLAIRDIVHIIG